MEDEIDPLDPASVAAMIAVVVEGVSPDDAWIDYVRSRYPEAAEELAALAMTDVALELLVSRGHLLRSEARYQRRAASARAAGRVRRDVWREIHRMKRLLERLDGLEDQRSDEPLRLVSADDATVLDLSVAIEDEARPARRSRTA